MEIKGLENKKLKEENKKLKEENKKLKEENEELRETLKGYGKTIFESMNLNGQMLKDIVSMRQNKGMRQIKGKIYQKFTHDH